MPRIDVLFTCAEQDLTPPSKRLRAGDKNYFYAVFKLCEKWQGMQVRARFRRVDLLQPYVIDLADMADGTKECLIPWEVLTTSGTVYVGIFAGDLILTNEAPLYVDAAFDATGGDDPQDPTRDWFISTEEQLADLTEKVQQSVEPPVKSVNGKIGAVNLDAKDVGALPADTEIPTVPKNVGAFTNDTGYQTAAQVQATAKAAAAEVEAKIPTVPANVSAFANDVNYQTAAQVEATAKAKAAEVEAKIPSVPGNVGAFENDVNYQTAAQVAQSVKAASDVAAAEIAKKANEVHTHDDRYYTESETDELLDKKQNSIPHYVATVNGQSGDVTVTHENIGAEKAGTAAQQTAAHNTDDAAHNDIRLLLKNLTDKVNAVLDSDDTTLDQMSEIVAYIKNNADLIAAVTTNKVNYSDIVDNISTNVSNKPLSAAQGVALKALIDAITVPTKVSQLDNDASYQNAEQVASAAQTAAAEVEKKIPTVPTNVSEFANDAKYATEAQVTQAVAAVAETIPDVPTKVSAFNNDAGYQNAQQVQAAASAAAAEVEKKIPTVPTAVSSFNNDAGYQTAAQVTAAATAAAAAVEAKIPTVPTNVSVFTNDAGYQTAAQVSEAASTAAAAVDKTYIVEAVVTVTTSGLAIALPSDVTYTDVDTAVSKGLHVLFVATFPSEAGTDFAGSYVIPFTKKMATNGYMYFSTTVRNILIWVQLDTSGNVTFGYYYIEQQSNKVTSLSASSTDTQYPTAKAVYDYIESRLNGLTFKTASAEPTTNDPNVITFVNEG